MPTARLADPGKLTPTIVGLSHGAARRLCLGEVRSAPSGSLLTLLTGENIGKQAGTELPT